MTTPNAYAVPLAVLDGVKVPPDQQVEERDVHVDRDYVPAAELDRARLLSPSGGGTLRAGS